MEKIRIKAPAKVNLYLEITGKRQDGYHNIISLVEKINLCDEIEISPFEKNCVEFQGPWKIPEVNTVTKTIETLAMLFPEIKKRPVRVTIRKNIPPGSGLGGASSDAASILKACNKIWKIKFSMNEAVKIGSGIGSDIPLFLYEGPCIIEGRGEIVQVLEGLPLLFFNILVPGFQVSTKSVYENVTEAEISDLTQARSRIKILLSLWRKNEMEELEKLLFNRLEEVTLKISAEIARGKRILEGMTGKRFVLTGSGGGVYAIGNTDIRNELPDAIRDWRHYKTKSYRKETEKEEQHGNY